jgi:hypothetical protein
MLLYVLIKSVIVTEIQKRLGDQHILARDPIFVIRFAVARQFDLPKTLEMLTV